MSKTNIKFEDLPQSPDETVVRELGDIFQQKWGEDRAAKGKTASILRVLIRVYGGWFMLQAFPTIASVACNIAGPILLQFILKRIESGETDIETAAGFGAAYWLLSVVGGLVGTTADMNSQRVALACYHALTKTIYEKSIRL